MTKPLVLGVAFLALSAAPVSAAGLSLTWDACATNAGAASDKVLDCADPSGIAQLFGVFNSPSALPADGLQLDFSIDLQVSGATLPDFWNFNTMITPAACNDGVLLFSSRPGTVICSAANPWLGPQTGCGCDEVIHYRPNHGGSNRGRLLGLVSRPSSPGIAANTNYYGFHLEFISTVAVEAGGACAGCSESVAIVWNSALIRTTPSAGVDPTSVPISGAGIASNCATVNGATSICAATPARNRTWGALKSLYR
jgi:hypothetical protein